MIEHNLQYVVPAVLGVKAHFTLFPLLHLCMMASSGAIV
jgi:hypothetical protein